MELLVIGAIILGLNYFSKKGSGAGAVDTTQPSGDIAYGTGGSGLSTANDETAVGSGGGIPVIDDGQDAITVYDDRQWVKVAYKGETLAVPLNDAKRRAMADEISEAAGKLALAMQNNEIPRDNDLVLKLTNKAEFIRALTQSELVNMGEVQTGGSGGTTSGSGTAGGGTANAAFAFSGTPNADRIRRRRQARPSIISKII